MTDLKTLALAATPGPWVVHPLAKGAVHQPEFECWIPSGSADAAFIAAANPSVILKLLEEHEMLREALNRIREEVRDYEADTIALQALAATE